MNRSNWSSSENGRVKQVTLRGPGGEHRLASPWWVGLLCLASACGWRLSPASWGRRAGQLAELAPDRVTDDDATALADALATALDDIPNHDALTNHAERGLVQDPLAPGGLFLSRPPRLIEWFSGENKRLVREVIAFARKGAFEVDDPTV